MGTRTSTRKTIGDRRPGAVLAFLAALLLGSAALAGAPATASAGVDDWVHTWEVVRLVEYQQSAPAPPTMLVLAKNRPRVLGGIVFAIMSYQAAPISPSLRKRRP